MRRQVCLDWRKLISQICAISLVGTRPILYLYYTFVCISIESMINSLHITPPIYPIRKVLKMKILAIDTSGQHAGVAIVDDDITIGEILLNARQGEKSWTHSEILMPAIDSLFSLVGLKPQNIDYIAYTAGPGSFTGLRIGASTALGMARALNKPTIPVPTLDALAYNVVGITHEGYVVPMMDARRGQVYFALYKPHYHNSQKNDMYLKRLTDYMALPIKEAVDKIIKEEAMDLWPEEYFFNNILFIGDGANAYKDEINKICIGLSRPLFPHQNLNRQRAASAGVWAMEQIKTGNYTPTKEVEILYVRPPQAIRDAKQAKDTGSKVQ